MDLHEAAMLDLARQMAAAGVKVMMAMDNLDTMFHPPRLVEQCSASFYERASRICHEHGSRFFVHACGQQKANLGLIASLGVDGLEGVAPPPLGDVELDEAMRLSGDRMIVTGGISAIEFERLKTREAVFGYIRELFERMAPWRTGSCSRQVAQRPFRRRGKGCWISATPGGNMADCSGSDRSRGRSNMIR